jgi:hypothetical protein
MSSQKTRAMRANDQKYSCNIVRSILELMIWNLIDMDTKFNRSQMEKILRLFFVNKYNRRITVDYSLYFILRDNQENLLVYFKQFDGRKNYCSHLLVTTWPFSLFFAISLKPEKHLLIVFFGNSSN